MLGSLQKHPINWAIAKVGGVLVSLMFMQGVAAQPQAPVKIFQVQARVYDQTFRIGGTVNPFKKVEITAQVPGEVTYVAGIEGDRFKAGEVLASTDEKSLLAKRSAAMAQWQKARYAYQNAIAQYNRELWKPSSAKALPGFALPNLMDQTFVQPFSNALGVGDKGVENRANLIAAKTAVDQALAAMERIKSEIAAIDVQLSHTKLKAPFDGVIVKKMVEAGDVVQPGQPLFEFAKTGHLTVEVNIPVNLMNSIHKGQVAKAVLAGEIEVPVRVAQIFPIADDRQHTVKVKFDLPVDAPAAPGMYAEVEVKNQQPHGLAFPVVPVTSILKRGSLPDIYVFDPKTHKVMMRVIRIGKRIPGGYYVALSGIHVGEYVVDNPPPGIKSGMVLENGQLTAASPREEQVEEDS